METRQCTPRAFKWAFLLGALTLIVMWLALDRQLLLSVGHALQSTSIAPGPQIVHNGSSAARRAPLPQLPRVALLFLTRGSMPLRPVWAAFFSAAAALTAGSASDTSQDVAGLLFSIFVHPPPEHRFPRWSEFYGHEVPNRVVVEWGKTTEVAAYRALLREALMDPLNQRFLLISDSCVPLYQPATIWLQLMSEQLSRVTVCSHEDNSRYRPGMIEFGVTKELFRKASEWSVLTRKHAEVVAYDDIVIAAFHKTCRDTNGFCLSAEHYVPTALAYYGLEPETDCSGVTTYYKWEGGAHPKQWGPEEATLERLHSMRGPGKCTKLGEGLHIPAQGVVAEALRGIRQLREQPRGQPLEEPAGGNASSTSSGGARSGEAVSWQQAAGLSELPAGPSLAGCSSDGLAAAEAGFRLVAKAAATLDLTPMPSRCPLFARKIAGRGNKQWAALLEPIFSN